MVMVSLILFWKMKENTAMTIITKHINAAAPDDLFFCLGFESFSSSIMLTPFLGGDFFTAVLLLSSSSSSFETFPWKSAVILLTIPLQKIVI